MRRSWLRVAALLLAVLPGCGQAVAQTATQTAVQSPGQLSAPVGAPEALSFTGPVRMLDCGPVTPTPCFFTSFTPVDGSGRPAPVALPPRDVLLSSITLTANGNTIAPFYVSTGTGPSNSLKRGIVLIAIDVSGSMNERSAGATSRFEAARGAIDDYLRTVREGLDEVAIVPFESHQVVPTIQAAVFTGRGSDLQAQVAALPVPSAKNNTALFQAVFTGVQTLQREVEARVHAGAAPGDLEPRLIVMTDGKNEVLRGDDPGLLAGPLGLEQAAAKVQASHLDVIGIGFGEPSAIDQPALARLSTRHFLAQNKEELERIFRATEPLHSGEITVGFLSPWQDRQMLAATDLGVTASLRLPGAGGTLRSPLADWHPPAMATPLFSGHAGTEEMQALIRRGPPPLAAWNTLLRGLLVLLGSAALLLLLWFWVPRLVWPDGVGEAIPKPQRWAKGVPAQAAGVQARPTKMPAGFAAAGGAAAVQQRSAAQITQVRPRGEFSRTRRISEG